MHLVLKKKTRILLKISDTSIHVRNHKLDPKIEWVKKDLEIRTKQDIQNIRQKERSRPILCKNTMKQNSVILIINIILIKQLFMWPSGPLSEIRKAFYDPAFNLL